MSEAAPTPTDACVIEVSAESLEESYFPNEEITFMVSVENKGGESIQLEQFPPDIQIEHSPSNKVVHVNGLVIYHNDRTPHVFPYGEIEANNDADSDDAQKNHGDYNHSLSAR